MSALALTAHEMSSRYPPLDDCGWYLVDNSELNDPSPNIKFRLSKHFDDRVRHVSVDKLSLCTDVTWGTRLRGRDC